MPDSTNYKILTGTAGPGLNFNVANILDENQFVNINRIILVCDTTVGPINIQLPKISNLGGFTNFEVLVDDSTGTSGTYPITITVGDNSDNILGAGGVTLSTNYGKMLFCIGKLVDWVVFKSGCCVDTFYTQYFTGVTTQVVVTPPINPDKPLIVVADREVLSANTGVTIRDFSLLDELNTTRVIFTVPLVAGEVQVQYYSTDLID